MSKKLLLWLDDWRNPADEEIDWLVFSPIGRNIDIVWVKSYAEFVDHIMSNGLPDAICFDHDLGLANHHDRVSNGMSKRQSRKLKPLEKTGHDCAKWCCEYCAQHSLKFPKFAVQSANPEGKENIIKYIENYIKHCE